MGKIGDRNYELPQRMFVRKRRGVEYFFCHIGRGISRKEISLGSSLRAALAKYRAIADDVGIEPTSLVHHDYYKVLHFRMSRSAKTRGIAFLLSIDDVEKLMRRAGGKCEVSGLRFTLQKHDNLRIRPWMPSIDRIDATAPYSVNNCRVVCAAVNVALNQFGDELFFRIASAVSRNLNFCGTTEENCGSG